ncbi:MAG TPA: YfiR family protein [Thermoanaerobaculia bacterium]|nr:YfiR family protein [Thermoanaerobaculia bacterium]
MAVLKPRPLLAVLLVLVAAWAAPGAAAAQPAASEYDVKAAFLYNFTKFVEWPDSVFPGDRSNFQVCVLGADPFGKSLQVIADEQVAGRGITLLRTPKMSDPEGCQILFICQSEKEDLTEILAELRDVPVLTVGDTSGFIDRGGIINFTLEGGKVRFEINQEAADRAGIKISSKLLRLATRVKGSPGAKPDL